MFKITNGLLKLRRRSYAAHPRPAGAGLQDGSLNPPEPVAMPWDLTLAADINFSVFGWLHLGHSGFGSSEGRTNNSN
jgi:hypothetical protein